MDGATDLEAFLKRHGIIARGFAVASFDDKLRYTIGRDWEMEKTAEAVSAFMAAQ